MWIVKWMEIQWVQIGITRNANRILTRKPLNRSPSCRLEKNTKSVLGEARNRVRWEGTDSSDKLPQLRILTTIQQLIPGPVASVMCWQVNTPSQNKHSPPPPQYLKMSLWRFAVIVTVRILSLALTSHIYMYHHHRRRHGTETSECKSTTHCRHLEHFGAKAGCPLFVPLLL